MVKAGSFLQQDNSQLSLNRSSLVSLDNAFSEITAIHLLPCLLSNTVEMQQRSNKTRTLFTLYRVLERRQVGRRSERVSPWRGQL